MFERLEEYPDVNVFNPEDIFSGLVYAYGP